MEDMIPIEFRNRFSKPIYHFCRPCERITIEKKKPKILLRNNDSDRLICPLKERKTIFINKNMAQIASKSGEESSNKSHIFFYKEELKDILQENLMVSENFNKSLIDLLAKLRCHNAEYKNLIQKFKETEEFNDNLVKEMKKKTIILQKFNRIVELEKKF